MITYGHLWWIKSTYDGWRRLKMLFWSIWASIPTISFKNKTVCVFFQGASDANAKIRRNIARKSKNAKYWIFKKSDFQKSMNNGFEPSNIYSFSRRIRIRIQNWTKTPPRPDFLKIMIFIKIIFLYRKGPPWGPCRR